MSAPRQLEAMESHFIALANLSGGDLRKLLSSFFGFLHKRTDFYVISDSTSNMGFREGDAEKLMLACFRQFPLRKMRPQPASSVSTSESKTLPAKSPKEPSVDEDLSDLMANVRLTDDGLQIPVGNGGSTEDYKWTQTIEETSVLVPVPPGQRGKDLNVSIKASSLSVKTKNGDRTFVEGDLTHNIVPDESTWTLEGGALVIVLYKRDKTFWKTVLEGDDEIDASLVDSRRHIDEYDSATQAQIRKIIFDQNQAQKGGPSSDELLGTKPDPASLKMPAGVEYIDQDILDEKTKGS